jgi:hypothetical protein
VAQREQRVGRERERVADPAIDRDPDVAQRTADPRATRPGDEHRRPSAVERPDRGQVPPHEPAEADDRGGVAEHRAGASLAHHRDADLEPGRQPDHQRQGHRAQPALTEAGLGPPVDDDRVQVDLDHQRRQEAERDQPGLGVDPRAAHREHDQPERAGVGQRVGREPAVARREQQLEDHRVAGPRVGLALRQRGEAAVEVVPHHRLREQDDERDPGHRGAGRDQPRAVPPRRDPGRRARRGHRDLEGDHDAEGELLGPHQRGHAEEPTDQEHAAAIPAPEGQPPTRRGSPRRRPASRAWL